MNKTEDILERLKGQMPQVPDSDFLTESIMSAVTAKPGSIVPMWFKVLRVVSSAAAVFLIGLFIGLNSQNSVSAVETAAVASEVRQPVSRPSIKDENDAIREYKDRMERRKQRQIRQTRIENLYAKI
ncbi:MAG: hypothetical protein J5705_03455 [Bacteroidaceae bacterium]|nr:hypothetical protein [Bacteroidaceae bacterium]